MSIGTLPELEDIMQGLQQELDRITVDAVIEWATGNMADEHDYPDERELTRAAAELLVSRLRKRGILPPLSALPTAGFYTPPF